MSKQKYISWFILFVIIHYLEGGFYIGGLSFAQLWKLPILAYLLYYNIVKGYKHTIFEKSGYALVIEYMLSQEFIINPLKNIIDATKNIPLMLFYGYWKKKYSNAHTRLEAILYSFAQFICLSSILVLLGVITPVKDFRSAEYVGVEGAEFYSGLFTTAHAASSYFCAAFFVLINALATGYFKNRAAYYFNIILAIIGLYSIYQTYTRTGWMMLIVGILCFIDLSKVNAKKIATVLVIVVGIAIAGIYLYNTNEFFQARISGSTVYKESNTTVDVTGSGRNEFWSNAVTLWSSGNYYQLLFGFGNSAVIEHNQRVYGLAVFSHSQFFDALVQHGIIGLILLILFYYALYVLIQKHKKSSYYKLCRALFFAQIIFAVFQQEMYFNYAIIFSIAITLLTNHGVNSLKNDTKQT